MSTKPSVCCICLTADRQTLTDRAVKCFQAQTYDHRWLLIFDTGNEPYQPPVGDSRIVHVYTKLAAKRSIGALRNEANAMASSAELLAHWDSDDWSDPGRLTFQEGRLHAAGDPATGFHNMLFLDRRYGGLGNAWLYDYRRTDRVLGTSLMYTWDAWDRCRFPEGGETEDKYFMEHVYVAGYNSVVPASAMSPLMVAEVHGGNTSGVYGVFDHHNPAFQPEWRRAPEWDDACHQRLYPEAS